MSDKQEGLLRDIFLNVFPNIDRDNFSFNKDRSEFENWDSLAHMQLAAEIESCFGVVFDINDLMNIDKPIDFFDFIKKSKND